MRSNMNQRQVFMRLMSYAIPHRSHCFCFFLLALTTAGEVLGPIIVKVFIDDYLTHMTFPLQAMIGLAAAYVAIHIGKVVLSYFQLLKFQEIALKIIQQLRIDVFLKYNR